MNFDLKFSEYQQVFNDYLSKLVEKLENDKNLISESMAYALSGGGKRIRPILCLATADMLGVHLDKVLPFALAIECIHTYSLVHDDLPAMDNDDYRRGRLATHKKYGEAFGILTGDGLLNLAFEIMLSKEDLTKNDARAISLVGEYAGSKGMILGQTFDLLNEKQPKFNEQTLYDIYINKTAKLIMAPILVPSILANDMSFENLKDFGENLGILFQISDDILDVESDITSLGKTPHKDEVYDKLTAIKVFGLDGAKQRAKEHFDKCILTLNQIDNSEFLIELTKKIYTRKN